MGFAMDRRRRDSHCRFPERRGPRRVGVSWWLLALCLAPGGCAAVSNPVADGIPVRRLPAEYLSPPKADLKTIPLTLLRQKPPEDYLLDGGDVLGVYIEGVVGEKNQPPPVRLPEAGA